MGNLCSIIDADADINYKDVHSKYAPQHLGQSAACHLNGIQTASTEKRSSHSSSPDRRRTGARDAPTVTVEQQEQLQDDAQWRSPPGAAADSHPAYSASEQLQPEQPEPETPTVPFSWTKGELIGIGAFGRVFSALNNVTGELVAVKQVSFAKDEALQGRVAEHIKALEAEVEVLKTLKHENIVRYLGTEITEDSLHIFLEYVPGGSIASLLAKFGAFPEPVIRVYTAQLLRGLEYLHQKGIMHRDIKGANILIDKAGTVKLADFGASKKIEDLATVGSGSKSIRGTPYWMAPEVIKQTGHGRPADIWSLACTVIEMATGKPPWSNYTAPVAAMFQIASSKDPPPLPEHLSREAKDFLLLCFNRVARERANATRLLKHPFLASAQLQQTIPQSLPVPLTPGSTGAMSSSSSSPAGGGTSGTPGRAAEQRQQHGTPLNARQSSGIVQNGTASHRPPVPGSMSAAQVAALKTAKQLRASPNSQSRCSPKRQHAGLAEVASPAAAAGSIAQRVDAAAPMRSPKQQQQQQLRQQEQHQIKQQQPQPKQQRQQSPQRLESSRQQQEAQQHPSQQQHQQHQQASDVRHCSTPFTAAPAASNDSEQQQQEQPQNCMTLVDWNPVQEPSWLPPYQVSCAAQQPVRRPADSSEQQRQIQQPAADWQRGRKDNRPSLPGAQQQATVVPVEPEVDAPRLGAGPSGGRGAGILASSNPTAAGTAKRASMAMTSSSSKQQGMASARKPADMRSPRSASITSAGSPGVAATGPLANGPAGRASSAMSAGLGNGMAGGSSILAGVGPAKHKPRPSGLQGSLPQQQQQQAASPAAAAVTGSSPGRGSPSTSSAAAALGSKTDDAAIAAGHAAAMPAAAAHSLASGADQWPSRAAGLTGPDRGEEDVAMSSKRAQWESELYEELERHRQEQRATRMSAVAQRQ